MPKRPARQWTRCRTSTSHGKPPSSQPGLTGLVTRTRGTTPEARQVRLMAGRIHLPPRRGCPTDQLRWHWRALKPVENALDQAPSYQERPFLYIAGDFRPAVAKRWVQKYFGGLRPSILAAAPESDVTAPVQPCHLSLTDRIGHATIYLVWKTVPAHHPDEPAIDVLASILGGESRGSRLFRALIDDR